MEQRGLDKMKNIRLRLIFILSINLLIACSAMPVGAKECKSSVKDSRFSDYIFDGPYTVKQANQLFRKEIKNNSSKDLANNWKSFLSEADNSGCIYRFTASEADWDELKGVKGFALTKDAKVVNIVITKKS